MEEFQIRWHLKVFEVILGHIRVMHDPLNGNHGT
jgi:hypothetical protein